MPKTRFLYLSNRDSDNAGDQLAEETGLALIKTAMKNLEFSENEYTISSRALSIVPAKYISSGDSVLLKSVRAAISKADVLIFGGVPRINHLNKSNRIRLSTIIATAHELNVPVILSGVGVEVLDAQNTQVQELQRVLRLPNVKMISTFEDKQRIDDYVGNSGVATSLVSDPLVLCHEALKQKDQLTTSTVKKIGLVIAAPETFASNKIDYEVQDYKLLLENLIADLANKGLDYKIFTTGNHKDELFLADFARSVGMPATKLNVLINSPQELLQEVSTCTALISFRLQACVAAYSHAIPTIGLASNERFTQFFDSIGYGSRAIPHSAWTSEHILQSLMEASTQGTVKDDSFVISAYAALFAGIKEILDPGNPTPAFTLSEFTDSAPIYLGDSQAQYCERTNRKMGRIYQSYLDKTNAITKTPIADVVAAPTDSIYRKIRRAAKSMLKK